MLGKISGDGIKQAQCALLDVVENRIETRILDILTCSATGVPWSAPA